ncbi:MAG: hypothetical protein EOP46_11810 [Sphingobacteriaceae bacterium]|nr:MAG: hypothetical protein EOP46_11810 [Sphingobacteriaceae bacterium]
MRKIFTLLTLAAIALSACRKENKICCDVPEHDFILANIKDTTWTAELQTTYYRDSLNLWAQHGEEHLFFRLKFNGLGKYPLKATEGTFFYTVGMDVITGQYITADNAGEINITLYDKAKNIIEGNFTAQMQLTYPATAIPEPIKMYMQQGKFRVRLPK